MGGFTVCETCYSELAWPFYRPLTGARFPPFRLAVGGPNSCHPRATTTVTSGHPRAVDAIAGHRSATIRRNRNVFLKLMIVVSGPSARTTTGGRTGRRPWVLRRRSAGMRRLSRTPSKWPITVPVEALKAAGKTTGPCDGAHTSRGQPRGHPGPTTRRPICRTPVHRFCAPWPGSTLAGSCPGRWSGQGGPSATCPDHLPKLAMSVRQASSAAGSLRARPALCTRVTERGSHR